MIKNFHKVRDNLFRGSEPTTFDVEILVENFDIQKIISLDEVSGMMIVPVCKRIGVKHFNIDIDPENIKSLKNLLKFNINELLNPNVKTFVHCFRGKDRTGLLIAIARCMFDNWCCKKAIKEAKMLGYGTGLEFSIERFYTKLIKRACKHSHNDKNDAYDIVSNVKDFNGSYIDVNPFISWAPFVDESYRKYPEAFVNLNPYEEQYETRENYGLKGINTEHKNIKRVPSVGVYDQITSITNLVGPSFIGGGFV